MYNRARVSLVSLEHTKGRYMSDNHSFIQGPEGPDRASSAAAEKQIMVQKRDGRLEPLDLEKIHRVITWAAEGLANVSVSEVEIRAHLQFFSGIRTADIHETIVNSAAELISAETPDYQYLAARLAVFHLRKRAFGRFQPPHLLDHVRSLVAMGKYDNQILEDYSTEELEKMNDFIDHSRDMNFSYAAIAQLKGKYLLQNRVTGEIYESAQFLFMMAAACLFSRYPKDTRMGYVKRYYNSVSLFRISKPTPIMSGVRTPSRQFSSCVLIEAGDSLDSIIASAGAAVKYVSQRAGVGLGGGRIRALGSEVSGGEKTHTGVIPFWRHFQTAIKSCSQGGVRGGAATVYYPIWHLESESLLVLKNNRGVEENRIRHLDYGVQLNRLMYERLQNEDYITLFSPSDVPGLHDAFFEDQKRFESLYVKYENDPSIRKKRVKALGLFSLFMGERAGTNRIYVMNVDHANTHSSFVEQVAPVRMSNLCVEITLPTKPLEHLLDEKGEIALCTLSAINLGTIEKLEDLEDSCDLVVRALDALLDYQDYPVPAARLATMDRRPLGVGVINFAYYLAKNGARYSDGSAINLTHRTFEALQFYLLKASNRLAIERGACPKFHETKYSRGILPIDTYKRTVDSYCTQELLLDWESLRASILKHGLRNSTLTALMPSETSSQISNATNGIEPPRGLVSVKKSKDGVIKQVVPEIERLREQYELLWDLPDNDGALKLVGVMQKFVDQSISANTYYVPSRYKEGKLPMTLLLADLLKAYSYGVKTLYYQNTKDEAGRAVEVDPKEPALTEPPASTELFADDSEACDSCTI